MYVYIQKEPYPCASRNPFQDPEELKSSLLEQVGLSKVMTMCSGRVVIAFTAGWQAHIVSALVTTGTVTLLLLMRSRK